MCSRSQVLNLLHLLVLGPVLLYIGLNRLVSPKWLLNLLVVLGVVVILYHGYLLYNSWDKPWAFIYLIHVLIVGPSLIWVGLRHSGYELLVAIGAIAMLYNAWRLYKSMK